MTHELFPLQIPILKKKRPCWKYLFIYLFYYDRNQSVPGKNELCSIFLGESAKAMISGSSLKKKVNLI